MEKIITSIETGTNPEKEKKYPEDFVARVRAAFPEWKLVDAALNLNPDDPVSRTGIGSAPWGTSAEFIDETLRGWRYYHSDSHEHEQIIRALEGGDEAARDKLLQDAKRVVVVRELAKDWLKILANWNSNLKDSNDWKYGDWKDDKDQ